MSVHKLLAALKKEAELQEKAIMDEAEGRAREILAAAGDRAAELQAGIESAKKKREAKREALRLIREKILLRRRATLARERLISEIFSACAARFRGFMETPSYAAFLKREYEKLREDGPEIEEIRADPQSAAVFEGMGITGVTPDKGLQEGFLVKTDKGRITVRCLFRLRMEKVWEREAPGFMARISKQGVPS